MNISEETIENLARIYCTEALNEREIQYYKEVLAKHKDFVLLNIFRRIDINDKDYITSLDIVAFFKDNGVIISEQDSYILIAMFDSNKDGKLSFIE